MTDARDASDTPDDEGTTIDQVLEDAEGGLEGSLLEAGEDESAEDESAEDSA
jgi:hypothetical protein